MNKTLLSLLFLATCSFITRSQPLQTSDTKPFPPQGTSKKLADQPFTIAQPLHDEISCTISFYYNASPYYTEKLGMNNLQAYRGEFEKQLSWVSWSGFRCQCWIVLYQKKYWKGLNLGLWTDLDSGNWDLSQYVAYDFNGDAWESWTASSASYSVYCY